MIEKISCVDSKKKYINIDTDSDKQNISFNGLGNALITGVQMCEKYPMLNVSALDMSTAIIPRTYIETKESNGYAEFEAFRRESSGLFVNCLIPSFVVMGVAKLLQKPIMGEFNKSSLVRTWANNDSIDKLHKYYANSTGTSSKEKVYNTIVSMLSDLSGVDGSKTESFSKIFGTVYDSSGNVIDVKNAKIKSAFDLLAEAATDKEFSKKKLKKAYETIVNETHISENIKFKGDKSYFSNNLESVCDDTVKLLRGIIKENISDEVQLANYFKKAKSLVNWKSIGGLGIIIPLAISMQPINRWITRKTSGQKGAPIYKDFGENKTHKELSKSEKWELLAQKFVSIGSMIGVASLSMFLDKPLKNMFQFKGIFPTMDQARIISTATFASRMAASEDKNELRESTVRDIVTFSGLYFLGDYVAKGIATVIEKYNKNVHLINYLKPIDKDANILKRVWHWAKHTAIKSSDELSNVKNKNLRTICQIGNIVFSFFILGVFVPFYTRSKTNKKHAEELAKSNYKNNKQLDDKTDLSAQKQTSDNFSKKIINDRTTFKSFLDS